MATLFLAGLAGVLASLSPCVLALLPIVLGAAAAEHRLAPLALVGVAMLSGLDRRVEAVLTAALPDGRVETDHPLPSPPLVAGPATH